MCVLGEKGPTDRAIPGIATEPFHFPIDCTDFNQDVTDHRNRKKTSVITLWPNI